LKIFIAKFKTLVDKNVIIRPNSLGSTRLDSSRLDTTRHVRRVEPMHFGCVELVEEHRMSHKNEPLCYFAKIHITNGTISAK